MRSLQAARRSGLFRKDLGPILATSSHLAVSGFGARDRAEASQRDGHDLYQRTGATVDRRSMGLVSDGIVKVSVRESERAQLQLAIIPTKTERTEPYASMLAS